MVYPYQRWYEIALSGDTIGVLAKRGRIKIIRTLRAYPERDFTVNELARTAGVPTMTTWRAVSDLKKTGFVKTRRVGNALTVKLTEDRESLRVLRLVPDTDPQRGAARVFAEVLAGQGWACECRLFGSISRGEHNPGEEVDVAVVFDDSLISEQDARARAAELADKVRAETNIPVVPLCVSAKDMARKGGIAAELRDREIIWRR